MRRVSRLSAAFPVLVLLASGQQPASAQTSVNMVLRSNFNPGLTYNDVWGYTAPNGDEYAIVGTTTGTSVVNIVDRTAPYETGFIPGVTDTWRDIKTYDHYAYVSTEGGGGVAIIDLDDPENPVLLPSYTGGGLSSIHNLYVDEAAGRLYTAGANLGAGGTRILDLTGDPENPVEIGSWETNYFHDVMAQNGRLYGASIYDGILYVLDVSNPASITTLGTVSGYANSFTHNAWVTADDAYVMTTDETGGAACRMWDLSGLPTLVETDNYLPNPATIPHNTHIVGNLAVISHYELGVRVVDITDPFNLVEAGYYDTWPAGDGGGFNGCWGAYPFFPNSPELILASDRSTGLYVLEYGQTGTLQGTVSHSGVPGSVVSGAVVELVESSGTVTSASDGAYEIVDLAGNFTLQVSAFGYQSSSQPVSIAAGGTTTVDVALTPVPGGMVSGTVTVQGSGSPVAGATVEIVGTPLAQASDGSGDYAHLSVPSGGYTVRCSALGYNSVETTLNVGAGSSIDLDFSMSPALVGVDFESGDGGWLAFSGGGVTSGFWQLGDPQGTEIQSEDDHTPDPGVNAWITELAGTSAGSNDVDGGVVELVTPDYDLTGLVDPQFAYYKWFSTGQAGNAERDDWVVEVSSNNGSSWALVERTDLVSNGWELVTGSLSSLLGAPAQVRFRFTAQDTGLGSLTEAGVDDFTIFDVEIQSPPTDAPAVTDAAVLALGPPEPNPARAGTSTELRFTQPTRGAVKAVVYDVAGRRVSVIADAVLDEGAHRLIWDGRSDGRPASAGVYFVRVRTGAGDLSRKVVVVR